MKMLQYFLLHVVVRAIQWLTKNTRTVPERAEVKRFPSCQTGLVVDDVVAPDF